MPARLLLAAPLFDERRDIVSGKKEVGTYDIPDDGEPGACVYVHMRVRVWGGVVSP